MFLITNSLVNSEIAFRGFRGFGPDSRPVNLKELTLFTGKNGSGKSTFVKLLQMMSDALKDVNNMEDLMNLEINIGTDILGGANHLLYDTSNKKPRWIGYIGTDWLNFYDTHFIFKVQNRNILRIDSIELYLVEMDQEEGGLTGNKFMIGRWTKDEYLAKWKMINEVYIPQASWANTCEGLRYYVNKLEEGREEYQIINAINLNEKEKKDFDSLSEWIPKSPKDHPLRFRDPNISALYIKTPIEENNNKPFYTREVVSEKNEHGYGNEYLYVNNSEIEFKIVKEDISRHLRNLPLKFRDTVKYFLDGQKSVKADYDFADMLMDKANWLFDSEFIIASLFDSPNIPKLHSSHFYINGPEIRQKYFDLENKYFWIADDNEIGDDLEITNEQAEIELNDWYEENGDYEIVPLDNYYFSCKDVIGEVCNNIIREVMKPKYEYYQTLMSKYRKIYEQGILDFVKFISGIAFQSNVVYGVERTYNIYRGTNQYSKLLNFLDGQDKVIRNKIIHDLNMHLSILGIDKKLSYQIKENAGFIYLDNHGRKINLIDEGSGISKVIGLLFFIVENIYNREVPEDTRLLVLEEPESNLHPSLQSKLADLFIDVLTNNNICLLIETHSEYLIRRLQYLVATNEIESGQVGINYFQMKLEGKRKRKIEFYEINIGKDGRLSREFGPGFFDEADNLSIELFLKNKNLEN